MNAVELPTEFGATDDVDILRQATALADQHLIGWQYWHYKNWADPTTQSQGSGAQGLFNDDADLSTVKKIGRASCRERVCQYGVDLGGRRIIKKKKHRTVKTTKRNHNNAKFKKAT